MREVKLPNGEKVMFLGQDLNDLEFPYNIMTKRGEILKAKTILGLEDKDSVDI